MITTTIAAGAVAYASISTTANVLMLSSQKKMRQELDKQQKSMYIVEGASGTSLIASVIAWIGSSCASKNRYNHLMTEIDDIKRQLNRMEIQLNSR